MLKKLPIGIQTFSELIEENYVYVDKTKNIYQLIQSKNYFLSRPRRFGKSLLCTTLKALFEGKKELFKDLWIDKNSNYDWKKYPVIHIDFNLISHETPDELKQSLINTLNTLFQAHELPIPSTTTPGSTLITLTTQLFEKYKTKVVLIIDEYDKAILRHINDITLATTMREALKSFYEPIKGLDEKLQFVFITGVTKFSKTSIFSGLNNLKDLTLSHHATTLLGYTEDEIETFFAKHLNHASEQLKLSQPKLISKIRNWYDGYFFESQKKPTQQEKVYNPFSVLNFFDSLKFSNYWFATGTPTFLINVIKTNDYPMQELDGCKATENSFESFDITNISLKILLFQTGYLTIKDYNPKSSNYTLSYPNKETGDSLLQCVFESMTTVSDAYFNDIVLKLKETFDANNLEQLHPILTELYAVIPYTIHISKEKYYQTIFFLALKLTGAELLVEQATNIGQLDMILQTTAHCFIIEFKHNHSATIAINQIEEKKYYQPYLSLRKKITLIGIGFDETLKNVKDVIWKELHSS